MASLSWKNTKEFTDKKFLEDDPIGLFVGIVAYPMIPFVILHSAYLGIKLSLSGRSNGQ